MSDQEKLNAQRTELVERLDGPPDQLRAFLADVHSANLAEWMQDLSERQAWQVFDSLSVEDRAEVLEHAEDSVREQLLEYLTPRQLGQVVEELPADEVVDLLELTDENVAQQVLRGVDVERAEDLRRLALYAPDSAGGVMTSEFVTVPLGTRIGDAIKLIKSEGEEVEEGSGLFVLDEQSRPVGYVSDRALLTHSIHDLVDSVMEEPITVNVSTDQEEAANEIVHYGLSELAVVDDEGKLVGVISADDASEVLGEEASEDMFKLVGTSPIHQTRLPILRRVLARIPLQAITVVGGLVTAAVIDVVLGSGEKELPPDADLLRFVPIVIGLAGNAGIQASTILVRAFATGEVEPERETSVLASESLVGVLIGLICGAITFLAIAAGTGFESGVNRGLAVGAAILVAVSWAAFLGCIVPMTCRRAGIDPAIVAGPFLLTVSDVSGTGLYLCVAHLILHVG